MNRRTLRTRRSLGRCPARGWLGELSTLRRVLDGNGNGAGHRAVRGVGARQLRGAIHTETGRKGSRCPGFPPVRGPCRHPRGPVIGTEHVVPTDCGAVETGRTGEGLHRITGQNWFVGERLATVTRGKKRGVSGADLEELAVSGKTGALR